LQFQSSSLLSRKGIKVAVGHLSDGDGNATPGSVGRVQFQNRAISTLAKPRKDRTSSGHGLVNRFPDCSNWSAAVEMGEFRSRNVDLSWISNLFFLEHCI